MSTTVEKVNEDPQFTGPRPTPTIPDGGSYSVYSKSTINATPAEVLHAITDLANIGQWNPLVSSATVDKPVAGQTDINSWAEGQVVTFNCVMDKNKPDSITKNKEMAVQVGPIVTRASLGDNGALARTIVRWISQGTPSFIIKAEHVNWIDDNGDGTCTYQHWETFSGFAVVAVKLLYGKALHDAFVALAGDLKAYIEKKKSMQ